MTTFGLEKISEQETPVFIKELADREKVSVCRPEPEEKSWIDRALDKVKQANMAPEMARRKAKSFIKESAAKAGIPSTSLHLNTDHKEKLAGAVNGTKSYVGWHLLSDLKAFASYSAPNIFGQIRDPWALEFHKALTQSVGTLPTGGEVKNDTSKQMLDLMMANQALKSGMSI